MIKVMVAVLVVLTAGNFAIAASGAHLIAMLTFMVVWNALCAFSIAGLTAGLIADHPELYRRLREHRG